MKCIEIPLSPEIPSGEEIIDERGSFRVDMFITRIVNPTATVYFPVTPNGTSIVICPGGGYGGVCITKEGHDIARTLANWGVTPLVLKYRLPGGVYQEPPVPLIDAWHALRLAAQRAAEWKLDTAKIGIMGFSAGGHLAMTAAMNPDKPRQGDNPLDHFEARAQFQILGYPVVTFREPLAHKGTRNALIGADAQAALVDKYSGELQVTKDTVPTFMVHSEDDGGVPIANSEQLLDALKRNGVPAELVRHPTGGHGYGMGYAAGNQAAPDWMPRLNAWMRTRGLL
ncbi:MAG: alpha/beta hydrolase [Spirochaetes bacterium]|nr:alpha/beta hydrolase [Spirochaetota bacterium]